MTWCGWKPGVFLLTAYYAVLAGLGPGFHFLFDPHHHSHAAGQGSETPKEIASAKHSSQSGCNHCHHHDKPHAERIAECCEVSQRDSVKSKSCLPSVRETGHEHDHDCQLCQWFAQSQSNGLSRATELFLLSVICRNETVASLCVKEVASLHLSRGPPAAV